MAFLCNFADGDYDDWGGGGGAGGLARARRGGG